MSKAEAATTAVLWLPMVAAAIVWLAVALWPTKAERAAWRNR